METKEGRIELGLEPDPIKSNQEREDERLARQLLDEEEKKIQPTKASFCLRSPQRPYSNIWRKRDLRELYITKITITAKTSIITKPKKQQKTIN